MAIVLDRSDANNDVGADDDHLSPASRCATHGPRDQHVAAGKYRQVAASGTALAPSPGSLTVTTPFSMTRISQLRIRRIDVADSPIRCSKPDRIPGSPSRRTSWMSSYVQFSTSCLWISRQSASGAWCVPRPAGTRTDFRGSASSSDRIQQHDHRRSDDRLTLDRSSTARRPASVCRPARNSSARRPRATDHAGPRASLEVCLVVRPCRFDPHARRGILPLSSCRTPLRAGRR